MDRRQFLLTAAGLAVGSEAFARSILEGEARRTGPDRVRLQWTPASRPMAIYVSTDPDAPLRSMRKLETGLRGGQADVAGAVSPRPYYLLRAADGAETRVAERLLPLQGGRNFRDLGGYRAADGRQVRWGRLYRSGVMSGLTAQDLSYLSKLGVQTICDFRSTRERVAAPAPWGASGGPRVVARDYDLSASLEAVGRVTTREQAISAFAEGYAGFAETLAPQYTDMFARLVRGEAPLAFNCSAGKDRTGMAAALILSVLGVPRDTVIADYALTQVYTPPSDYVDRIASGGALAGMPADQMQAMAKIPREAAEVMAGSDPEIMRQALTLIDQRFGCPEAMARAKFGVTRGNVAQLRRAYLI